MKFMLIMNSPRDGYTQYMNWPKKILEANFAFMESFTKQLADAGELVCTYGLASPEEAKRVRVGKDGKPVTDGIFPESKEYLAGFWIVDVESPERAFQIAAEAATAPGDVVLTPDGSRIEHLWIEVRQVMGSREDMK
jgi:hypothetical protein